MGTIMEFAAALIVLVVGVMLERSRPTRVRVRADRER
jgi:hypothetical protein